MNILRPFVALGLLALVRPPSAHAQLPEDVHRVLLLVVGNDGPASVRRAEAAFQRELESRQIEVVIEREPQRRPGELPVVDGCIAGSCLSQRLTNADAQLLVGLGAWFARERPQVILTLDDGHGPANVTEPLAPGETDAQLAHRMLDQALHLFQMRRGVVLRVEGTPHGASVVIDHRPVGVLPFVTYLPQGPHDITVAHVDYRTGRRHVELGPDGDELTVTLERETDRAVEGVTSAAPPPPSASGPSRSARPPVVGPVLLFVTAAAGIAGGAYGLTRAGCLDRNASGECLRRRQAPTAGIAMGFGGAALALLVGTLWYSLGGSEAPGSPHARLGIAPDRVLIDLSF